MNSNVDKLQQIICYNLKKNIIDNLINNYYEDLETMDDNGITDSYFEYIINYDLKNNRNNIIINNCNLTNSYFNDNDW